MAHSPGDSGGFTDPNGFTYDWSVEAIPPANAYPPPDLPYGHPSGPMPIVPAVPPPPEALWPVTPQPIPPLPAPPPYPPGEPPVAAAALALPATRPRPERSFRAKGDRRPAGGQVVSVDNNRCHLYAICQMEAPASFEVGVDGRLRYDRTPSDHDLPEVRQAARLCPMQAIRLKERWARERG